MTPSSKILLLALAALLCAGCVRSNGAAPDQSDPEVTDVTLTSGQDATETAAGEAGSSETEDAAGSTSAKEAESGHEEASSEGFQPPYPHRQDLFAQPNIQQLPQTARPREQSEVELKGFVNVDGVRALLQIDGDVTAIREGEAQSGVKVLTIAPPQVILQRGRVRWTIGLFDQTRASGRDYDASRTHWQSVLHPQFR